MTYTIESETVYGLTVRIIPDEDPMSPREWDNLGVMVCSHRDYNLGDEEINPGDYESEEQLVQSLREDRGARVVLPLYLLDHSGITMRAGDALTTRADAFACDPGGWDTSMVGFIIDTPETRKLHEIGEDTPDEEIARCLTEEVETYATYLEGGVVAYVVEDEDGTVLGSCHGFYSVEYALEEGRADAEYETRLRTIRVEDGSVVCPACERLGTVREVGNIIQTHELRVEVTPGGDPYVENGYTETAWDSYEEIGYECRECGKDNLVLPNDLRP